MARSGELAVSVVTTKNGLEDSTTSSAARNGTKLLFFISKVGSVFVSAIGFCGGFCGFCGGFCGFCRGFCGFCGVMSAEIRFCGQLLARQLSILKKVSFAQILQTVMEFFFAKILGIALDFFFCTVTKIFLGR